MNLIGTEETLAVAAAKAGMDIKRPRKCRDLGKLPSEVKTDEIWRDCRDPFGAVWREVPQF
jgi:hypothetical protein